MILTTTMLSLADLPDSLAQRIFSFCPIKIPQLSQVCRSYVHFAVPALCECMWDTLSNSRTDDNIDEAFDLISRFSAQERYIPSLQRKIVIRTVCDLWIHLQVRFGRRTWTCAIAICSLSSLKYNKSCFDVFSALSNSDIISIGTLAFILYWTFSVI